MFCNKLFNTFLVIQMSKDKPTSLHTRKNFWCSNNMSFSQLGHLFSLQCLFSTSVGTRHYIAWAWVLIHPKQTTTQLYSVPQDWKLIKTPQAGKSPENSNMSWKVVKIRTFVNNNYANFRTANKHVLMLLIFYALMLFKWPNRKKMSQN